MEKKQKTNLMKWNCFSASSDTSDSEDDNQLSGDLMPRVNLGLRGLGVGGLDWGRGGLSA